MGLKYRQNLQSILRQLLLILFWLKLTNIKDVQRKSVLHSPQPENKLPRYRTCLSPWKTWVHYCKYVFRRHRVYSQISLPHQLSRQRCQKSNYRLHPRPRTPNQQRRDLAPHRPLHHQDLQRIKSQRVSLRTSFCFGSAERSLVPIQRMRKRWSRICFWRGSASRKSFFPYCQTWALYNTGSQPYTRRTNRRTFSKSTSFLVWVPQIESWMGPQRWHPSSKKILLRLRDNWRPQSRHTYHQSSINSLPQYVPAWQNEPQLTFQTKGKNRLNWLDWAFDRFLTYSRKGRNLYG